jgi:hypothetical protein
MPSDAPRQRFTLRRLPSRSPRFADDVRQGLGATPKSPPPRWFYDALGSALFSAITNLPEYDVTRTEESILGAHSDEIVAAFGRPLSLVELGSGDARKTRLLIDALLRRQGVLEYVPIDIDASVLEATARHLLADFPALTSTRSAASSPTSPPRSARSPARPASAPRCSSSARRSATSTRTRRSRCSPRSAARRAPDDVLFLGADMQKPRNVVEPPASPSRRGGPTSGSGSRTLCSWCRKRQNRFWAPRVLIPVSGIIRVLCRGSSVG